MLLYNCKYTFRIHVHIYSIHRFIAITNQIIEIHQCSSYFAVTVVALTIMEIYLANCESFALPLYLLLHAPYASLMLLRLYPLQSSRALTRIIVSSY